MVGLLLMCVIVSMQMKAYQIPRWKSVIIASVLLLTGVYGSRIWYYIENGAFTGRSFYGAIFLSPAVFFIVSKLLNIPYGYALDFVAPSGCLTLAMVKIQCMRDGCCAGKVLYVDENYHYVKFPSQIVEMLAFLIIAYVLFKFSKNEKKRGMLFPWFMVFYGASRFVLDFFRGGTVTYLIGLTAGSFWSLVAFLIGSLILILRRWSERSNE